MAKKKDGNLVDIEEKKGNKFISKKNHRYAVIISARNESMVIGNLIESIKNQTYPAELTDIFVVADNCTDNTADVACSLLKKNSVSSTALGCAGV